MVSKCNALPYTHVSYIKFVLNYLLTLKYNSNRMKILVVGGCHTFSCGMKLSDGFTQLIGQKYPHTSIDYYAPFKLRHLIELFDIKPDLCEEYDLIIWQLGNYELQTTTRDFWGLFRNSDNECFNDHLYGGSRVVTAEPTDISLIPLSPPMTAPKHELMDYPKNIIKRLILNATNFDNPLKRLRILRNEFEILINLARNYKQKIIILTPLPKPGHPIDNFLRAEGRNIFMELCKNAKFEVIDVFKLANLKSYFLIDESHLNETGHLLLKDAIEESTVFRKLELRNLNRETLATAASA